MKFSISKQELVSAVYNVQKAITGRGIIPILEGILIVAEKSKLTLIGSNMDLIIESAVEANVIEEGKIVVDSRLFGDIIKRLPEVEITLEATTNNTLNITYLDFSGVLVHMDANEYPNMPIIEEKDSVQISQKTIKSMIKSTIFSASQEDYRNVLTGVLFEINNGKINFVALDGCRAAIRSEKVQSELTISKVVPSKTLNEVYKILEDKDSLININFSSNHIVFDLGNTKISSRLLEGEFIKHEDIIPKEYNIRVTAKRHKLLDSIERASLIGKEEFGNKVLLEIQEDKMIISSNSNLGTIKEKINIILNGSDLKIAFNSKYLLDILKAIEVEEVVMEFFSSINPCIIKGKENQGYTYMIMPVLQPFIKN